MNLLALETSTEACSVAVACGDAIIERFELAPRRHAELVLPWADALLAEAGLRRADLDAIAVGRGPGAFTGVRLGISIAQGIGLALDLPVAPVSTLATLALRGAQGHVLAALDARMGEVYFGAFRRKGDDLKVLIAERVAAPEAVELPGAAPWHAVGTGFAAADGMLAARLRPCLMTLNAQALPHAADLAQLAQAVVARGEALAPERVEPVYLRNCVALTLEQQQARRRRVCAAGFS